MKMYDDFYNEPNEFEQQIDEFKQSLLTAVKKEFLDEMEKLKKENATLQDFKARKDKMERDHQNALLNAKTMVAEAERKARRMRLRELLGENMTVAWGVKDNYEALPKCDKCDSDRKIHFLSPTGKPCEERCTCAERIHHYVPQELSLIKFYMANEKQYGDERYERHYEKIAKLESDYDEYANTTNIYGGNEFDKINRYGIVFLELAKCQEYCDWLNKKTGKG
jgi:hypothetical protein